MKKTSSKITGLVLFTLAATGLIACGPAEEYTVDFMIQNDTNVWEVLKSEKVVEGKVEVPTAPTKSYYNFNGWYTTDTFETAFVNTGINASCKAYSQYVAEEVVIHLNDDEPVTKNLVDVVNATYNPGEGLVFDGWYKDAAYQVKWNGKDVVKDLYAKSAALITFNNGYEDVYTELVKPGTVYTNPAEKEVAGEAGASTLEKEKIVEYYMDEKDIHYLTADGKDFDFTKPIEKNTTIKVNWNTKGLRNSVQYDEKKDYYFVETYTNYAGNAPVFSMQSKMTIEETSKNDAGEEVKTEKVVDVVAFNAYGDSWFPTKAKKLIVGEGIKSLVGFRANEANEVEEISLPSTLKIAVNSFTNMPNLKGLELNEGLEVLSGSCFKKAMGDYKTIEFGTKYDFDIKIPSTVKNLSMVPTNLTFAEGSKFFKEDGRIYLNRDNDKILVSDTDNLANPTIVVPEGVTHIQSGTYFSAFDLLVLPKSFKDVNVNAPVEDYPYNRCQEGSDYSFSGNVLFDKKNADPEVGIVRSAMHASAYAITPYVGGNNLMSAMISGAGKVQFLAGALPTGMSANAFCGDLTGWAFNSGKYISATEDAQLKANIILGETFDKLIITLRQENEYMGFVSFTASVDPMKATSVNDLINALKVALGESKASQIDEAIKDKTLVITQNNKEISADKVTGGMVVTILIK